MYAEIIMRVNLAKEDFNQLYSTFIFKARRYRKKSDTNGDAMKN